MYKHFFILLILCIVGFELIAQQSDSLDTKKTSFKYKGELSAWVHVNTENPYPMYIGGRYIPQLNLEIPLIKMRMIDFELSANIYGTGGIQFFDSASFSGDVKPYRGWARYSTKQFEFRVGLQKIDFGTATMLRPLRWFDQIDPRDPLQLTSGVWGGLARYYFLNNTNIWVWGLYGNKNPKGMEVMKSISTIPEFGGRIQTPIPRGEAGISYHHRIADPSDFVGLSALYDEIPENRIGIDAKWDLFVGLWFEGSWVSKSKDVGNLTNQELFTIGTDYTFGIGSGLNVTLEHMLSSFDKEAFSFSKTTNFTALSIRYPIGVFDNLNVILYYDWTNNLMYNFINWYRQFDKYTLYIMGYWNPKANKLPTMGPEENLYGGVGIQLMFALNH
ncbi:MAG: hypothetical protein DRI84_02520 [Bacteroidetes bacterium]|nr:MAG: hypothetical protein DRI84_02520 [Bacteroidota bacterium]